MFTDPLQHIQAEFERLDLLLHREILRLRSRYELSLDEFRGLYVSDQQVDSLIDQRQSNDVGDSSIEELATRAATLRSSIDERMNDELPWNRVVAEFGLSRFEQDVLLLSLAPEVTLTYETLYAYLNNDVRCRWSTFDLALRLFSQDADEHMRFRRSLLPEASLFSSGLLEVVQPTNEHRAWLATGFALAPPVRHYLLGLPSGDCRLNAFVQHRSPAATWDDLPVSCDLARALRRIPVLLEGRSRLETSPVLVFEGRDGSGRAMAAEAVCAHLGIGLVRIDVAAARSSPEPPESIEQLVRLQQRLRPAGIHLDMTARLHDAQEDSTPDAHALLRRFMSLAPPVFLICDPGSGWQQVMQGIDHVAFRFHDPPHAMRLELWQRYAREVTDRGSEIDLMAVAERFILTPGQISGAVRAAKYARVLSDDSTGKIDEHALFRATRAQSDESVARLAVKVDSTQSWSNLVLPPGTFRQVRAVAAAIRDRNRVYEEWGFGRGTVSATGLNFLFTGPSGTGKTLAAGIIARDLGLDLYKIDLSGVVSKYIGETEKNLDRIFRAAECSNAILFFDEADALFGKRSEVHDAHDRYANIEVAYLLQKMEDHQGPLILASNLSRNIDAAFSRRILYIVDFPLPDASLREQLWRSVFPSQAPLAADVDFAFLATQFSIAGGDIRNVALDAAFLAANDGQTITMKQIIKATARQAMKQGKVPSAADFKQYHALIADEDREIGRLQ